MTEGVIHEASFYLAVRRSRDTALFRCGSGDSPIARERARPHPRTHARIVAFSKFCHRRDWCAPEYCEAAAGRTGVLGYQWVSSGHHTALASGRPDHGDRSSVFDWRNAEIGGVFWSACRNDELVSGVHSFVLARARGSKNSRPTQERLAKLTDARVTKDGEHEKHGQDEITKARVIEPDVTTRKLGKKPIDASHHEA